MKLTMKDLQIEINKLSEKLECWDAKAKAEKEYGRLRNIEIKLRDVEVKIAAHQEALEMIAKKVGDMEYSILNNENIVECVVCGKKALRGTTKIWKRINININTRTFGIQSSTDIYNVSKICLGCEGKGEIAIYKRLFENEDSKE